MESNTECFWILEVQRYWAQHSPGSGRDIAKMHGTRTSMVNTHRLLHSVTDSHHSWREEPEDHVGRCLQAAQFSGSSGRQQEDSCRVWYTRLI